MAGINLRAASKGVSTKAEKDRTNLTGIQTDLTAEVKVNKETLELAKALNSPINIGCDGNCEACKKCITKLTNNTNSEEFEELLKDPKKLEHLSNYIGQENLEEILTKLQSGDELAVKDATDKFLNSLDSAFQESKDESINIVSIDTVNEPGKNLDLNKDVPQQQLADNTNTPHHHNQDIKLNPEQVSTSLNANIKIENNLVIKEANTVAPKTNDVQPATKPTVITQDPKINIESNYTPTPSITNTQTDIPIIKNQIEVAPSNENRIVSTIINANQTTQDSVLSKQVTVEKIKEPLTTNTAKVKDEVLVNPVTPTTTGFAELNKPKLNIQTRNSQVQIITNTPVREVVNAIRNVIKATNPASVALQQTQREVLQKTLATFQTKDLVKTISAINERLANKSSEPIGEKLNLIKQILTVEIEQRTAAKAQTTSTAVQNQRPSLEERFIRLAAAPQVFEKALNRVIERAIPKPEIIRQVSTELKSNIKDISSMMAAIRLAQKTGTPLDPKITQRLAEVLKTSQTSANALEISKNRIQTIEKIVDKQVPNLESSIKKHIPQASQDLIHSRNLSAIIAQLNAIAVNHKTPELAKLLAHLQNLEAYRIALKASSDALEEALEEYYETKKNLDIQMLLRAGVNISLDSVGNKKRRSAVLNKNQLEQVRTKSVNRGVIQQSSSALDGATSAKASKNGANSQIKDKRSPTAELLTFLGIVDDSKSNYYAAKISNCRGFK